MRIGFIGNSHLAAIKLGWDEIKAAHPGVQATFFGSPGVQIKAFRAQDAKLVPGNDLLRRMIAITSGGLEAIDPDDFDVFVLVGATYGIAPLVKLHQGYRADSHRDASGRPHRVSDDLFEVASHAAMETSLAFRVIETLRVVTEKPVIVIPQPATSAAIIDAPKGEKWRALIDSGDHLLLAETLSRVSDRLSSETLTILKQPEVTLQDAVLSRSHFAKGAVALQDPTLELAADDYLHMNTAYGVIVLNELLAKKLV